VVPKLSPRRGGIEISDGPSLVAKHNETPATRGALLVEPAGHADAIEPHRDRYYRCRWLAMVTATGNDDGASRSDPDDETIDHRVLGSPNPPTLQLERIK